MMKWKTKTETTNIGVLDLDNVTFNDEYLQVSIDICSISDSLKVEIEKAIEIAKKQYTKEKEATNKEHGTHWHTVWSNKPVVIDFTFLNVTLEIGKPVDYQIYVGFHDADDETMEQWDCPITVDLSEYANDLKKAIIKVLVDKFF